MAKATMQAISNLAASDSASDLSEKFEKISKSHALLLTDADALVNRGLLDRARVDQGRPCQGYRATIASLFVLITILREQFPAISGSTPLTTEDLKQIEKSALAMRQLLDEREVGAARMPAEDMRARAVSKLVRSYGEVRRMITFVRWWAEDADQIAPSLWSGRRNKSKGGAEEGDVSDPENPVITGPNNGGGPFTS